MLLYLATSNLLWFLQFLNSGNGPIYFNFQFLPVHLCNSCFQNYLRHEVAPYKAFLQTVKCFNILEIGSNSPSESPLNLGLNEFSLKNLYDAIWRNFQRPLFSEFRERLRLNCDWKLREVALSYFGFKVIKFSKLCQNLNYLQ